MPDASARPERRPRRGAVRLCRRGRGHARGASARRVARAASPSRNAATRRPPGRWQRRGRQRSDWESSVHILARNRRRVGVADLDIYDSIPKVELHCHVEGTVRPSTVVELARKNGRALRSEDPTELYRYTSLNSFLEIFWLVQELLADRDDGPLVAYESIVDAVPHGLRYREMFFTPARHLAAGQDLAEIVAGLTEGLERAEAETGIGCTLICDIERAHGPAAGLELIRRLGELRRAGQAERVIGMGM